MSKNPATIPTFRSWIDDRYHTMSDEYRRNLAVIVNTCKEYAEGNIWAQRHTDVAVELIGDVAIPVLGIYPGEVSQEEREWFAACVKPSWLMMREDAISQLPKVNSAGEVMPVL